MGAIGRVSAEPTNTSDSFPLDELMQPDYRYLNSAIYPNTGVYDGDVTANALYDWDLFSPTAGQYLPANSTTITQCTAGNFCAGATNIHYDSIDQGITSCSTLGDNSYTQSATGSTTETDCYRNCSGNVTIEHATTITGNDYYGNGTDTCAATACENGYHTDNNACGANVLTITWANSDNPNTTCTYGGSITTPATAPTIPGKTFVGWAMGYDFSTFDASLDGIESWNKSKQEYSDGDMCRHYTTPGAGVEQNCNEYEDYSTLNRHEWKTEFSYGTIYGISKCLVNISSGNQSAIETGVQGTGSFCYCKPTGYKPNNSDIIYAPSNNVKWLDYANARDVNYCLKQCATYCSYMTMYNGAGAKGNCPTCRSKMFGH